MLPENLSADRSEIDLYTGWDFKTVRICDLVLKATRKRDLTG